MYIYYGKVFSLQTDPSIHLKRWKMRKILIKTVQNERKRSEYLLSPMTKTLDNMSTCEFKLYIYSIIYNIVHTLLLGESLREELYRFYNRENY